MSEYVQLDEGVKTGHIYNIDEYKNENNLLEVYWACSKNVCRNGAKCFQRGKEIWCQCPKKYTGLLCEIKKADPDTSCSCDNGTVRKLAIAFIILFVLFILFFIIAIVMYRKNVPWCRKKEKKEWCEPVQQRLEDDWKIKEFLIKDIVKKPYKHGYDCRQAYETSSDTNCEIESQ